MTDSSGACFSLRTQSLQRVRQESFSHEYISIRSSRPSSRWRPGRHISPQIDRIDLARGNRSATLSDSVFSGQLQAGFRARSGPPHRHLRPPSDDRRPPANSTRAGFIRSGLQSNWISSEKGSGPMPPPDPPSYQISTCGSGLFLSIPGNPSEWSNRYIYLLERSRAKED